MPYNLLWTTARLYGKLEFIKNARSQYNMRFMCWLAALEECEKLQSTYSNKYYSGILEVYAEPCKAYFKIYKANFFS